MTEPILHPDGFVQYDLPGTRQLHIWSPRLPVAQRVHTPIHDHTFDFRVRVLTGTLRHNVYAWVPEIDNPTHTLYTARPWLSGDSLRLVTMNESGEMTPLVENTFVPGGEYVFKAGWFHESFGEGDITATVMEKTRSHRRESARIAVPYGQEPDNNFPRYPTEETITLMLELVAVALPLVPVEWVLL